MGGLPRLAWIIGGVVIVGIVVVILVNIMTGGTYPTMIWDWVFDSILNLDSPPPSPFS